MSKIAVIFYSLYGHTASLAQTIATAARAEGATVDVFQIPETLSEEIRTKMHAPPRNGQIPDITPDKLKEYDGFIFGIPTRYGRAVAQVSQFFDATGGLWATQALSGKTGAVFSGSGTQHGGAETTILTTIPWFTHQGIIYVPIGYHKDAPELNEVGEVIGGSPWGAASISSGTGARAVSEKEAAIATVQGKSFAKITNQFVRGKISA